MAGKEPHDSSDLDGEHEGPDDFVDDQPTMGRRTKLALVIGGVAAVVVLGLAIGYAVFSIGQPADTPGSSAPSAASGSPTSSGPTADPEALLTDASMLDVTEAKRVAANRSWKVASTLRGIDDDSPQPACLGAGAAEGQPASQQTTLRLLSSSGKQPPGILHRADAYATPEEAAQAYRSASKALGDCTMAGAYLDSGSVVTGLGDEAVAAVVNVTEGGTTQFRSVALNRTGRVVNVLDVAQPARPVALTLVVQALAAVTDAQCTKTEGRCAQSAAVKPGPPPPGGDQPGFLAVADLPPVGSADAGWAGTVPRLPEADFTGSGCETVNWAKTAATKRTARTYLLSDDSPTFGLDDIVLTLSSAGAAQGVVTKVKADLDSCATRKLTASVSSPARVSGVGAGGATISGWTATVSQKTTTGTARYRVGIVSAGTKTAFTFLNPQQRFDLTDAQWSLVTVRAGQRATQVS